jgi:hypothetical protein
VKILLSKCAAGYHPVSGGNGAFTAAHTPADRAGLMQREWLGGRVATVRVQTVITDVPAYGSAMSFVRRP